MNEKELKDLLQTSDEPSVEQIGERYPATDDATRARIWQRIQARQNAAVPSDYTDAEICIAKPARSVHWVGYAAAAAVVLLVTVGAILAIHRMPSQRQDPVAQQSGSSASEMPTETSAAETSSLADVPSAPLLSEQAADYLHDTLVPQYGLSELSPYDAAQAPPESAQGILSAAEQDFTGDGTPDLLVVRQDEAGCLLELYIRTNDGYALTDIYPCVAAENIPAAVVNVSAQDDLLLVSAKTKPDYTIDDPAPHYQRFAVLSTADGSFAETAVLQYVSEKLAGDPEHRTGDFFINGKLQAPGEGNIHEQFAQQAQASLDALRSGGVRIPDTEILTDMYMTGQIIRIVSGMIPEQRDMMRHDYTTTNTVTAVDFTGLERQQSASTPEEVAYRFLRSRLIPVYGLSDSHATFDLAHHQEKGLALEYPHDAQGIVSAHVTDLNGDGSPELLTVRAERTSLVIDWYRIGDDTCTWAASRKLAGILPRIYLQDGLLILNSYTETNDSYTTELSALRLTDDGLEEALHIVQQSTPDKESLSINGEEISAEPDALDADMAEQLVREALDNAGIRFESAEYYIASEQPYDYPCNFLSIHIPDDAGALLTHGGFGAYRDVYFSDHTRLHLRLLGEWTLDAPLWNPLSSASSSSAADSGRDDSVDTASAEATFRRIALRYVQEELIPQFGRSDLQPFLRTDGNAGTVGRMPPKSTQGIISAILWKTSEGDLLATVRSDGFSLILEFYEPTEDGSFRHFASYLCCTAGPSRVITPHIMRNTISEETSLVIRYDSMELPEGTLYSSRYTVLRIRDGALEAAADLEGRLRPGIEELTVNGKTITAPDGKLDRKRAESMIQDAISAVGMKCYDFTIGSGVGLQMLLPGCFDVTALEPAYDGQYRFIDYSGLSGYLMELEDDGSR